MRGPLPPDVTLDVPYWWQPGMPLWRLADYMAPVPLKRKRDMSAEPKTDPVKREHTCACPWQDIRLQLRLAKQLVPDLFGPVAPDTFRRWHDSGAPNADPGGRPSIELPPFAFSRLANLTHAVTARLSLSIPSWQHETRRVLRELDIEFEPGRLWTLQFLQSLQLSWKLAASCTRHRPGEADIARERNLL